MDVPSNEALQYGREFGNRGQCNPTYFTVGNLVKHLTDLEESGVPKQDIIDNYVFLTAGACGPCRFGTYVTEYRKALRDSGFDGFRVLLFQQTGGLKQATGEEVGLELNPKFFWGIVRAIFAGDVLNALMYRIRPYEVVPGATDKAIDECKKHIADAFRNGTSIFAAMYKCRKILGAVEVDRTRVVPKVGIIGEFWAMTTEGDGNYGMQRFLESEGAEVDVQLVAAWLLYMVWQSKYDTAQRADLRGADGESKFGLAGVDVRKRLFTLAAADKISRGMFQSIAHLMGLYDYHLADMDELAEVSHAFYDNNLRGGEGHMEVGKLILNVAHSKVNMTLSVKPFGCMPSSSVSDGVQSMITEMYPQGIFLPVETNGDGAVNVYSRVQMQLFKAKQLAQKEVDHALAEAGMTMDEVKAYLTKHPKLNHAFHRSPHFYGSTAADLVREVGMRKNRLATLRAKLRGAFEFRARKQQSLAVTAKIAAAKAAKAARAAQVARVVEPAPVVEGGPPPVPAGRTQLKILN
jgi:predicted nucleotide-binding protein (sugar kinase/HSP70/actin superfamily)